MKLKNIICVLIFIFLISLSGTSNAKINKQTVARAWKNISKAADFESIPVNYESDSEPNAWVAYDDEGNYSLHVTTGLMKILDSESEIAGILGHELGHIVLNHYNSFELNDTVRTIMTTNIEHNDDLAQAVGNIDLELKESKFSREQETEADEYGVKILSQAGYDIWGLYNAMEKFDINGYETERNGFNSHPASDERLDNIEKFVNEIDKDNTKKSKKNNKNNNNEIDDLANILLGQ